MHAMYVSPKEFETAMMEVNIAFEIVHKKVDTLQERIEELEQAAKQTNSTRKTSKSQTGET